MDIEPNKNYLLYYTKYHPYIRGNNKNIIDNESLEINEDENDNNNIINGRWSQKEHLLFIKGCLLYGNNWKKVQAYIQTRSCSQIRSHSQKYFYKLNKKYQNNNNIGKLLTQEEINKLINKNKLSNKEMENAELQILSLFNCNKDKIKDKYPLEEINNNNYNNKKRKNQNMKTLLKEKIFEITKIPKEQKFKQESEENEDSNNMNESEKENEEGNNINEEEYEEESKKILKRDILADHEDNELITQKEEFINKCLDSKDPKDLVNLLKYFGNDVNFRVNDINMLKKYQFYLGLDIDNSEDEDSKNKNEENNININNTTNAYYPYIITPSGKGIQFNPLFSPKIVFNPQIVNQS